MNEYQLIPELIFGIIEEEFKSKFPILGSMKAANDKIKEDKRLKNIEEKLRNSLNNLGQIKLDYESLMNIITDISRRMNEDPHGFRDPYYINSLVNTLKNSYNLSETDLLLSYIPKLSIFHIEVLQDLYRSFQKTVELKKNGLIPAESDGISWVNMNSRISGPGRKNILDPSASRGIFFVLYNFGLLDERVDSMTAIEGTGIISDRYYCISKSGIKLCRLIDGI